MTHDPTPDWSDVLPRRQLAYSFLSQVFREPPTAGFIPNLAREDLFSRWPLPYEAGDMNTGVNMMRQFCAAWDERLLADLESDFNRLFIGPATPQAPPWESYYLNPDHLLFQEQTLAVREAYRKFGVEPPHGIQEPDDSLTLELAFIAELCARAADAPPAEMPILLEAQREFLATHLLQWAPECLTRIIKHATLDYYRAAAHLTMGSLAESAATSGRGFRPAG